MVHERTGASGIIEGPHGKDGSVKVTFSDRDLGEDGNPPGLLRVIDLNGTVATVDYGTRMYEVVQ